MADFNNCSEIAISGGSLTKANHISNIRIVHKNIVQREEEKRTRWDDYNRVRIGDIWIESSIATPSARRYCQLVGRDIPDVRRNFGIARLRGEDREDKFLCVTYRGADAFKAFKQDFDEFSQFKHENVAQIFGFSDNEHSILALLFYDALVPLERFIKDDDGRGLTLQFSYFEYQFCRMQMELPVDKVARIAELWVGPRTGVLQRGPYNEQSPHRDVYMQGTVESAMPNIHSGYLSIPMLSDNDIILDYLAKTFATQTILQAIRWFPTPFTEHLAHEYVTRVLSSLSGTIYNRYSRKIVARSSGFGRGLKYMFYRAYNISDVMRENQIIMEDGSVRFTVTPIEMNKLQKVHLQYALPWQKLGILRRSWLAQAHHTFGQLQIHADEWENYTTLFCFNILLTRSSPPGEFNGTPEVYLFIPPVPRPSDDEGIWRSWVEGEKYFWSFDPLGQEKVSDFELASSGIPSFTSVISTICHTWSPCDYDIMQKLQVTKGFDPTTTDLALSTGYPILEVIGDDDRSEDLEKPSSDMLPPQAGRRGSNTQLSRASTVWSNHASDTKGLRTRDAKTMRSNSSAPGARGIAKHSAWPSTAWSDRKSGTAADVKTMRSSSRVQTSSRDPQSLGTEQQGREGGYARSRTGASERRLGVLGRRSSSKANTRRLSLPATRQTTSLAAARKNSRVTGSSGQDCGRADRHSVRLGAKKPAWR